MNLKADAFTINNALSQKTNTKEFDDIKKIVELLQKAL